MTVFQINRKAFSLKSLLSILCLLFSSFTLSSCDLVKNQVKAERESNAQFQDYRDGLATRLPETDDDKPTSGTIPDFQPYVAQSGDQMKSMPLVSISINQTVPIRDALYELAQQANYDIELDPRIRGSVIFTARNRPFDQVVKRIADIAGLRYKFDDDVLRVELDTPYGHVYKIDYLSYVRSTSSKVSNNISVVSGDGADSGSNFAANSESEINFWGELETNLEQIVRGNQTGALKTKSDPRIVATEQNPDVQAVSPNADGTVTTQAPQATLRVESLPVDDGTASSTDKKEEEKGTFTINKQAGLINVYASEKAHEEVSAYLKLVKRAVTSQVLIEAKILEVTLNDEFATGISWGLLDSFGEFNANFVSTTGNGLLGLLAAGSTGVTFPPGGVTTPDSQAFTASYNGNDLSVLIGAISQFGTVKALASPRLTVLNNQSAVLNVATNRVFFEIDIDVTTDGGGATQTDIDSEIRNVPEGVLVNVQPSINLDERTISMSVRPTITQVSDSINDPAVAFIVGTCGAACSGIVSPIPELNVQEIDSVIKVNSGQPIVMGGLLQDRVTTGESGVPLLSEVPVVGSLFKDHDDLVRKTELVIFLKATILDSPSESVHNTDKDLYRQFSSDRRPLKF